SPALSRISAFARGRVPAGIATPGCRSIRSKQRQVARRQRDARRPSTSGLAITRQQVQAQKKPRGAIRCWLAQRQAIQNDQARCEGGALEPSGGPSGGNGGNACRTTGASTAMDVRSAGLTSGGNSGIAPCLANAPNGQSGPAGSGDESADLPGTARSTDATAPEPEQNARATLPGWCAERPGM